MDKCEVCGASVRELRRGRCWGCYSRWAETRPVGLGASCRLCGERRSGHLRSLELLGAWSAVCHDCCARVSRLQPMPPSIAGMRDALRRERRVLDRRVGEPDPRTAPGERRASDRRGPGRRAAGTGASGVPTHQASCAYDSAPVVDEDMVIEIAELASELESLADDLGEVAELTRIHELGR